MDIPDKGRKVMEQIHLKPSLSEEDVRKSRKEVDEAYRLLEKLKEVMRRWKTKRNRGLSPKQQYAKGVNLKLVKALDEIQTLAGRSKNAFLNDRDTMRADHVLNPLERIFEICVNARSLYRPNDE